MSRRIFRCRSVSPGSQRGPERRAPRRSLLATRGALSADGDVCRPVVPGQAVPDRRARGRPRTGAGPVLERAGRRLPRRGGRVDQRGRGHVLGDVARSAGACRPHSRPSRPPTCRAVAVEPGVHRASPILFAPGQVVLVSGTTDAADGQHRGCPARRPGRSQSGLGPRALERRGGRRRLEGACPHREPLVPRWTRLPRGRNRRRPHHDRRGPPRVHAARRRCSRR